MRATLSCGPARHVVVWKIDAIISEAEIDKAGRETSSKPEEAKEER